MNFNPDKLRLLRESRGMSQSQVAATVGISQAALSKFEKGTLEPSSEKQQEIASFFEMPTSWFCGESCEIPSGLIFHRKRSSLSASIRSRIEAEARLRLMDVAKLRRLQTRSSYLLNSSGTTPEETARLLREFWGVKDQEPIDNLVQLIEKNGVLVLPFDFGTDKIDGFFLSLGDDFICIALNDSIVFAPDRRRFTLAHELGHALLHRASFPNKDVEREADAFAAEFLAPTAAIREDLVLPISLKLLFELKNKWKISMAAILYRAKTIGVIDEGDYRQCCIVFSSLGYRKKEPLCGLEPERPTLLSQMIDRADNLIGDRKLWDYLELNENVFRRRYVSSTSERGR